MRVSGLSRLGFSLSLLIAILVGIVGTAVLNERMLPCPDHQRFHVWVNWNDGPSQPLGQPSCWYCGKEGRVSISTLCAKQWNARLHQLLKCPTCHGEGCVTENIGDCPSCRGSTEVSLLKKWHLN